VASFDRSIPPGGEGKITLRLNTRGYSGDVLKKAQVFSNDVTKGVQIITIKARVKNVISINPRAVYFRAQIGQELKRFIDISAQEERPLKLKTDQFNLEKFVSFEIKEMEKGKKFQLVFNLNPSASGNFNGTLKLSTNYPEKPEIVIPIRGIIQKAFQTMAPKQSR
jgi:hypothetical protein